MWNFREAGILLCRGVAETFGMPDNDYLIIILAIATLAIVIVVAGIFRRRVAQSKGDPQRSAFTRDHGGPPRPNRPGTEH